MGAVAPAHVVLAVVFQVREGRLQVLLWQRAREPFAGPVSIHLEFLLPKPKSAPKRRRTYATKRPDLDKLARAILDSVTHILIEDDAQVVEITATKDYGQPGVRVTITEIAP